MPPKPIYPNLPQLTDDEASIRAFCDVAGTILKILTGQLGATGWANQTILTYQSTQPGTVARPVGSKEGDRWIQMPTLPTQVVVEMVWSRGAWADIT